MAKDRKIDMVILGLLFHENLSGYEIKKRIDNSISFFWKGSFGSIYPSLSALEKEGLIEIVPCERESARSKNIYSITKKGCDELKLWLENTKSTNDLKYETLLKLFFGGAVDNSISIRTIDEFEKEIERDLLILKMYKDNLSKVLDCRDHVFFYLTVLFGVETYEGYLRWCNEARNLLRTTYYK